MSSASPTTDVLLVGAGIMSATLASLLNQLNPNLSIHLVEQLSDIALESSDAWNNAGTGHAAYCELNYTTQNPSGTVEIERALGINAAFEVSLTYWASLVEKGLLQAPESFIQATPHYSFVWGKDNVAFLRERFIKMKLHHLFSNMQFSDDIEQLREWLPLIMQDREISEPIAATRVRYGTDVNFGALTRQLLTPLTNNNVVTAHFNSHVTDLTKQSDGSWQASIKNDQGTQTINTQFVFLGAGGGALKLLQKAGVKEAQGYGGFPVSGQWLVCENQAIVKQHNAKVYGKAAIGAPPMSVPHLDTRLIDGKTALLFGPFAGFTTKFLKAGSYFDLVKSIQTDNLKSMLGVARHNWDLTQYLIKEATQGHTDRMDSLRNFMPSAKDEDWTLKHAGKRVQIIKPDAEKGGKLEFGTEIVSTEDGSLAGLLGASPGASVSVPAMLDVIAKCFKDASYQDKLKALIPHDATTLIKDKAALQTIRSKNLSTLKLDQTT